MGIHFPKNWWVFHKTPPTSPKLAGINPQIVNNARDILQLYIKLNLENDGYKQLVGVMRQWLKDNNIPIPNTSVELLECFNQFGE